MEFMYDNAAHNFFLYLTPTTPTTTTTVLTPEANYEAEAATAYYYDPTSSSSSSNNEEMMMMMFKATHQYPSPLSAPPIIPYNQVQFPYGSMLMDLSYNQDFNEDIRYYSSAYIQPNIETSREAKVLRYKEKKKRRNFLKRIRYPSRKAYAETRPRIRGRFIKVLESDERSPIAPTHYNNQH